MISNIPKPSWHKPHKPKSFWQKVLASLFGGLGFFSIAPIPGLHAFIPRPLSYFVRVTEKKTAEKTEKPAEPSKESVKNEVGRQIAMWGEAADTGESAVSYKVQAGDSLWKIAENQYGDGMRWIDIWTANQSAVKEPNLIFAGQELKIPKFILSRTALFKSPAPIVKTAKITPAGEIIKRQIISATDSIGNLNADAAAQNEARQLADQAKNISDLNSQAVDLTVRTLDLGRETIESARTVTMAWSQDAAGNIRYYTMQNGVWTPSEVNPIGNIGAIYGTQDITQTPEYKSGKIIQIAPQPAPAAPAAATPTVPYGGAILNAEQQKIYEKLNETGGVAAEQYKQTILSQSPIAVAAINDSVLSATVGDSVSAAPATGGAVSLQAAGTLGSSYSTKEALSELASSMSDSLGLKEKSAQDILGTIYGLPALNLTISEPTIHTPTEVLEGFEISPVVGISIGPTGIAEFGKIGAEISKHMTEASQVALSYSLSPPTGPPSTIAEKAVVDLSAKLGGYAEAAKQFAASAKMYASSVSEIAKFLNSYAVTMSYAPEIQQLADEAMTKAKEAEAGVVAAGLSTENPEAEMAQGIAEAQKAASEIAAARANMQALAEINAPAVSPETPAVDLESKIETARADIEAAEREAEATRNAAVEASEAQRQGETRVEGRPEVSPDEPSSVAGLESIAASERQAAEAEAARAAEQQAAQAAAVESMTQESISLGEEAAAVAAAKAAEAPAAPSVQAMGVGTPEGMPSGPGYGQGQAGSMTNPGVTTTEPGSATREPEGGVSMRGGGYSTEQGRTPGGYATSQAEAAAREATHEAMADESKSIGQEGGQQGPSGQQGPGTGGATEGSYGGGLSEGPQGGGSTSDSGTSGGGVGSSSGDVGRGVD